MYYGLLRDPDLAIIEDNEDMIDEENDKPKVNIISCLFDRNNK